MIIIGIDPGYAITGFAVVEYVGNHFKLIDSGAILTKAGVPLPVRLAKIYDDMNILVDKYKPDAIAIEELFFNRNTTTAIGVAQGRGAILIVAAKKNIPIYEYTPLQVKQGVVGYGRADKHQVMECLKKFLKLGNMPKLDDTADALALAICHTQYNKYTEFTGTDKSKKKTTTKLEQVYEEQAKSAKEQEKKRNQMIKKALEKESRAKK